MKFKSYPPNKRRAIVERGWTNFESFFHKLPLTDQNEIYSSSGRLPDVDGFRRGTPAGNKKRLEELFRHLGAKDGSRESDRAWRAYDGIFLDWVMTCTDLNNLLLTFDNDTDFVEQPEGMPPNTDLDVACFAMLSQASKRGEVTREDITTFYDFGYFVVDNQIEHYIELAIPEKDVQSIRELRALPAKLDKLHGAVDALTERIDGVARDVAKHATTVHGIEERVNVLATPTDDGFIQGALASKADANTVGVIGAMVNVLTQTVADLAQQVTLVAQSDAAESGISGVTQDFTEIVVAIEAAEIKATIAAQGVHDLQVTMDTTTEMLRREIAGIMEGTRSLSERAIDARIAELRDEIARKVVDTTPTTSIATAAIGVIPVLQAEPLVSTEVSVWPQNTSIVEHLERNILAAGLLSRSAKSLAREVLAGLGAGQLVTFRGSVAPLIAELCAQTIAAQSAWMTRIPVGMLSSNDLGHLINSFLAESRSQDSMRVLIIDGLNRSALEVFGSELSSLIGRRLLNLAPSAPRLHLLGTVVDGPSALPIGPGLCELGPILDVDALNWSPKGAQGTIEGTFVPSTVWDAHVGAIHRADLMCNSGL